MLRLPRTRSRPGPLVLVVLGWLACGAAIVHAHDPGLSALDVVVGHGEVSAVLSVAAADVVLVTGRSRDDPRATLAALARDAIRMSVDGVRLNVRVDGVMIEDGAAYVRMSLERGGGGAGTVSTVRSDDAQGIRGLRIVSRVPERVARGHRQMLTVTVDGRVTGERLLGASSAAVEVALDEPVATAAAGAWRFLVLGVHHILSGYDHLVFLAGLLLASRTVRQLVGALTAFTAAHSVTIAFVALGGMRAPAPLVEPLIAASIAWVGVECLLGRQRGPRWAVVFGFGLIHGFGFAEVLVELGLGASVGGALLSLLSFNAGVEAGQLAVAAVLLPLVWMMRARPRWNAALMPACSTLIVAAGGYWLVERLL